MRQLSNFAKANPVKARIVITISHILLVLNAILLGVTSYLFDIGFASWLLIPLSAIIMMLIFFYPDKKHQHSRFKYSYTKQKIADFLLALTYFFVLAIGINQLLAAPVKPLTSSSGKAVLIVHKVSPPADSYHPKSEHRKTYREWKKNLKSKIRAFKKDLKKQLKKSNRTWLKVLLILLTVVLAIGLAYSVAALGCGLACSGYEALAVLVLIVGGASIIFGSVVAIRAILRKVGTRGKP